MHEPLYSRRTFAIEFDRSEDEILAALDAGGFLPVSGGWSVDAHAYLAEYFAAPPAEPTTAPKFIPSTCKVKLVPGSDGITAKGIQ